jgi:hypothetical protein
MLGYVSTCLGSAMALHDIRVEHMLMYSVQ